jgi:predicted membrane protein (TIGR00267 family)
VKWWEHNFQGIAFGLMDGVIMIVGTLVGLAGATGNAKIVILGALVAGIANSFSNAIGFYTSENAERGQQVRFYEERRGAKSEHKYVHSHSEIIVSTLAAFCATLLSLFLPVTPFFLVADVWSAVVAALAVAVGILAVMGFFIGKLNKGSGLLSSAKYVFLGLAGAGLGFVVGDALKHLVGAS